MRYGDRLKLRFENDPKILDFQIAPLMLLSFVENAFKHGVSGDLENPFIDISMNESGEYFVFVIYNSKSEIQQKDDRAYKKGIGVSNVKRQLDIIYGSNYDLDIKEENNSYKVSLKLRGLKVGSTGNDILKKAAVS